LNPGLVDPSEKRGVPQFAAFAGMCLIWGTTFLVIRISNEAVPPLWGATLRLSIACVMNVIVARLTRATWPSGSALRRIALYGFLALGVNFGLLYWGEQKVPSGIAAVLYATVPLTTGLFARQFGIESISRRKMFAAVVGLLGVVLIYSGELRFGAPAIALLAVTLATIIASLAGVILKTAPPHSAFVVNAIGTALGAVTCFAASVALVEPHAIPHGIAGWGPILYLAVAGNLGAYILYTWLMTQWNASSVSAGALIIPVLAVIAGAIARGEAPAPETYAGAALVLAGVSVALFAPMRMK